MTTAAVLGFVLLPAVLLVGAVVINRFQLWSIVENTTLPWLCSAVAVALLLMGAVCVVLQVPPVRVPGHVAALTVIGALVIYGVGLLVDGLTYHTKPHDWKATAAGWLGFALILAGVFALPHL